VQPTPPKSALAHVTHVAEAVLERVEVKKEVLGKISLVVEPDV
jgi:3-hydroxyacyl-CoA dehydrogenase